MASTSTELSDEKTIIPARENTQDCKDSGVKPWTFNGDKPIESPCKLIRTKPPLELGPNLLGLGKIEKGIRLPTGTIWQPALYLLGSIRSAISIEKTAGEENASEWSNRADVFLNLQLSSTERLMLGLTPINNGANFTGYQFSPDSNQGGFDNLNSDIDTLWFEGDFGELFPRLKNQQRKSLDIGFSIGRQVIAFQDSVMMNDAIDSLVLVKNNLHLIKHAPSTRLSMVYAWNNINRADGSQDDSARFFGLFSETDTWRRTINIDWAYMTSDQEADGGFIGISSSQRIGHWSSIIRLNNSYTSQTETTNMRNGTLLSTQLNRSLTGSHNLFYVNVFAGFDEYRAATRDADVGSGIGVAGISFAAQGLGRYSSAISQETDHSYGMAAGIQWFLNKQKSNIILELAGKHQDQVLEKNQQAISLRFQKALGRRWMWQMDAYVADQSHSQNNYGIRTELRILF